MIFVKYGELFLKGKNKHIFINSLKINIISALKKFNNLKIFVKHDSIDVEGNNINNTNKIIECLSLIPGISYVINTKNIKYTSDLDKIAKQIILDNNFDFKTFAISCKRIDKKYKYNSMEIAKHIGKCICEKFDNIKVDLNKPELVINVCIRKNDILYYSNFDKIKGFGGFPVGVNGRVLMLISGGIDSPVAAKLLLKKGYHVDFLTFLTPPHTSSKLIGKINKLISIVTNKYSLEVPKIYVCNFTNIQQELAHISNKAYQITLMRRYFFRIARDLAIENKYKAIATGESLGQVASQTIESMNVIQNAIDSFLVLRPLLTYDKIEIIDLAKKINTYQTSIIPLQDCCSLFVPKNPIIKPDINTSLKLEGELELMNIIYRNTYKKIKSYVKNK